MTYLLGWNGHCRMSRKDMWEWCTESKPSKDWLTRQKRQSKYSTEFMAVRATINCERLILGVYNAITGDVEGCYYMTPSGSHYAATRENNWHKDKIRYLPLGGYSWYLDPGRVEWCWLDGEDEAIWWLENCELDDSGIYGCNWDDQIRRLDRIEANLSGMRRKNARERREERISDWVHGMAYIPDGFSEWAERVVFEGKHFAFLDKTDGKHSNRYHCTACGRIVSGDNWKQGKEYECPLCGATVKVRKTETSRKAHARASYFYPCKSMSGRDRVAMVTMYLSKRWRREGETLERSAARVLLIPTDGSSVDCNEIYYDHGGYTWSDINTYSFRTASQYLYLPDESILRGTIYEDMLRPVAAASARGWRLNYDYLMLKSGDLCANTFEYLIKGGFRQMTQDLVQGRHYDNDIKWRGVNADEVLRMNGQSRARLRRADGGVKYARWLRTIEICGYKISDDTLAWLAKNLTPTEIAKFLKGDLCPPMSVEKIANYVKKQLKIGAPSRNWFYGTKAGSVVQSWWDYLGMAKTLKLDLSLESVYKPKNLKERHDELAGIIAMREREKQAKAREAELRQQAKDMEAKYPQVAPVCARIRELYEWGDETYTVIVPTGAWAVMQEGVLLGHCTSRGDENLYLERIEQETSYIMFLRKTAKADSPWYTMEVEPGGNVIQLRTYGDKEGEDRSEAKAFLHKWRKEIAKRCGQGELTKAQKSKEMLLKYWDGLKANGNVIRGGVLKGKLLVDVLQADYRELNGDLPKEVAG